MPIYLSKSICIKILIMIKRKLEKKHIDLQFISLCISVVAFLSLAALSGEIVWIRDCQRFISLISGVFGVFIGVLALLRYYTQKSNMIFLFLGGGFLGAGILDIIGVLTVLSSFGDMFVYTEGEYSLTFIIPRVFLAVLLLISWFVSKKKTKNEKVERREELKIMGLVSLMFLIFVGVFVFILFKASVIGDLTSVILGLVSLLFYVLSLLGYLFNKGWMYEDFYYWIIFTITFLILSQLFYLPLFNLESTSMINLSVLAKFFAYSGLLVGFLNSIYQLYQKERGVRECLERKNMELNKTKVKVEEAYMELRKEKWKIVKKKGSVDKILKSIVKGK